MSKAQKYTPRVRDDEIPEFRFYRGSEPPRFANRIELEWAKFFDFYELPWDYEPTVFVFGLSDQGGYFGFRPDFYLPEQDLYVEITVGKSVTLSRKNKKIRKLRQMYPDVKLKVFRRSDFVALAARIGLDLRDYMPQPKVKLIERGLAF